MLVLVLLALLPLEQVRQSNIINVSVVVLVLTSLLTASVFTARSIVAQGLLSPASRVF